MPQNDDKQPRLASYTETVRRALYPPLIAMLVLAALLSWTVASLLSAARLVEHTDAVIAQATDALKLAVDAETGQRGYLIGGNPDFLVPYTQAEKELPDAFARLDKLVADDDSAQRHRVAAFRDAFARWQANAQSELTRRKKLPFGSVSSSDLVSEFNKAEGKKRMDEVRKQADALIDFESALRLGRTQVVSDTARTAIVGGVIAVLLIGGLFAFTTRKQMTSLSDQYEDVLNKQQQARGQLAATLYGIGDAVLTTDAQGSIVSMNPIAEEVTGWKEEEARGKSSHVVFDIVNETTRKPVESPVDRVIRDGVIVGLANHTILRRRDGSEIAIDDSGAPIRGVDDSLIGVVLVFRDVTDRRLADLKLEEAFRREALVNEVGEAIRNSPLDAETILQTAVTALGRGLGADRCYYGSYDQATDFARLFPEWHRDGLTPIAGEYSMSRFSINRDPSYRAGTTQAVEDVRKFAPPGASSEPGPLEALGLRAMIRVPVQVGNRMTTLAVAMSEGPRRWTENEIRAVETVASQVQSALEAARLLAEERQRAVREELLRRIGEAVLESSDPLAVQRDAVAALGEALQVDRCYFSTIDAAQDSVIISEDWHTGGIPSLAGHYRLSAYEVDPAEIFLNGEPQVIHDVTLGPANVPSWSAATAAVLARQQLAALIIVPFYDGPRLVATLAVGMARETRVWSPSEVELVVAVAAQTRTAVEAVQIRERERTIARQLQDALIPAPPSEVPGLMLASYYRPALEEAGVGGDFLDVFPLGAESEGVTALVVADLAGKGLAAAAQVATVRNMLRCLLYEGLPVDEAISRLNAILAKNRLLTGFTTLFVGIYQADARTLTYVNCGQEPGLVCRAHSGAIETLPPTGPILGGFEKARFTAEAITLEAGDILALFTDGLTEVGPTRKRLLGVAGVTNLLAEAAIGQESTVPVVERLIAGVDAFARGGTRDDMCLLLAMAQNISDK